MMLPKILWSNATDKMDEVNASKEVEMLDVPEFLDAESVYVDDRSWIDDEIRKLDEGFSRYMYARQTLHHLSERTLRRYRPAHLHGKRARNKVEREFSHRMVAAHFTYQRQSLLCAKAGAHFAAALMAVSATECLLLATFLELKSLVIQTPEYKRIIRKKQRKKKNESTEKQPRKPSFQQFMSSLQIAEQYKIAFQLGLIRDEDIESRVSEVLESYRLQGAFGLLHFVRNSRNQLHTGKFVASIDSYALALDVMYSPEGMALFQMNFGLCAYQMMDAVKKNLDRIQAELAITEGGTQDGDEAED